MDITDCANKINKLAHEYKMADFQLVRRKIKKLKNSTLKIFSKQSIIKSKNTNGHDYAFHFGGRPEIQYNIAYEGDTGFFRYGVAFSLQSSQSLPNPIFTLTPKIKRFNSFVSAHPAFFHDMRFWYYHNHIRGHNPAKVSKINDELIKENTFLFIGKYFTKKISELTERDFHEILTTFDKLLELYQYVENYEYAHTDVVESKIARICWNDHSWQYPSGVQGKSKAAKSFEYQHGFGYEEWLFDRSKTIDGWHYAFLQQLNLKSDTHIGKTYNISLYTMHNRGSKYLVGEIVNVECISREDSKNIYTIYKQNKWLNERKQQLKYVKADVPEFSQMPAEKMFNIRFKFENTHILNGLEELSTEDINTNMHRMKLLSKKYEFNYVYEDEDIDEQDTNEGKQKNTDKRKRKGSPDVEFDPIHDIMQEAICKLLKTEYKKDYKNVYKEIKRVDIKAYTYNNKCHYFEIKTDNPMKSIRAAIGQIMEYAYWPRSNKAEKLIIVSNIAPDNDTQTYMNHIRMKFNIPVYYRFFDMVKNILSKDY